MPVGTENIRNQKNTREGEEIGLRIGKIKIFLHIIGCRADKVDKPHYKETQHHGQYLYHEGFATGDK